MIEKDISISLVVYDQTFLGLSWKWLNDPEIKKLTYTPEFTREQQKAWFESLYSKTDYKIWGVQYDNKPIGVCGLKNITFADAEYWGYIGVKQYWGIGLGSVIMQLVEKEAEKAGLHSIWLSVIPENIRAIRLYQKNGYTEDNREGELLIMRKSI
jgi:RimJ/RimL family protein N-acetyltransferase